MIGGRRDEQGVSLILVLVTLVVFGLLVPILGQFGSANGVSGYLIEGQRYDRYAAEAGVQEAIAWAQANRAAGRHGVPCSGIQTGTIGSGKAARSATVKCQGYQQGGVPQPTPTAPKYALWAKGTKGVSGTAAVQLDGGSYRTNGAWWSNGAISASGVDASRDYVGASGSCGSLQAAPKECDQNRTNDPPDWNVVPGAAPTKVDTVREERCTGGNHVIKIEDGFHWQRSYFDMIADGDPEKGCGGGYVLWLMPGTHVFDFDFYGAVNSPSFRAAGPVVVVGGAATRWDPNGGGNQFGAARAAVRARAACDPSTPGATVVMAGASYFELNPEGNTGVDAQICGAPVNGSGEIPVSFAQVTHGSNPVDALPTFAFPASVTSTPGPQQFGWKTPAPLTQAAANPLSTRECSTPEPAACDENHAGFGRLTGDNAVGIVTMTTPDPIPAGVRLKTLTLTINHQDREVEGRIDRLRLYVTGLGNVANRFCDFTRTDHRLDPNRDWPRANEAVDVFTCDPKMFAEADEPYFPSGQPVRIVYEAQLNRNGGDRRPPASADLAIDEVRLDATFQRPTYRTSAPAGSPWILQVNQGARASFDGAVYTPNSDVLFDWAGSTENGFRRGVIVRSIHGEHLPDAKDYSPFELPLGGSYTDRVVTFAATVSGSDQTGTLLTARVLFCDPVPGLGPPSRDPRCTGADQQPVVLAWQTRR